MYALLVYDGLTTIDDEVIEVLLDSQDYLSSLKFHAIQVEFIWKQKFTAGEIYLQVCLLAERSLNFSLSLSQLLHFSFLCASLAISGEAQN